MYPMPGEQARYLLNFCGHNFELVSRNLNRDIAYHADVIIGIGADSRIKLIKHRSNDEVVNLLLAESKGKLPSLPARNNWFTFRRDLMFIPKEESDNG